MYFGYIHANIPEITCMMESIIVLPRREKYMAQVIAYFFPLFIQLL